MAVSRVPVRAPSRRPLATSVMSVTSVSLWKSDNDMISGDVHRSPGIYLTTEENPETVLEGCATSQDLKWGPLPPNEVPRIAQHVRKE